MKKDIKEIIRSNNKNISDLALIKKFEAALDAASYINLINSDVGLDRIQAYLVVLSRYNAIDSIDSLHARVVLLNQYRSTFCYKPQGFDSQIDGIERDFLSVCLEAGMGEAQLKALSYSFNMDDLKENDLMYLRKGGE